MSKKVSINLLDCAKTAVGCRISHGQLTPALSAVKTGSGVPSGILLAGYSKSAGRFFICNSEEVFVSVRGNDFVSLSPLAGSAPYMFEDVENGVARAVVVNGANALAHDGASFKRFDGAHKLSCGIMHCGRLFGADADNGLLLRWSGEGGIEYGEEKLNGAGSLMLDGKRGAILDISEYGERLVLVREYGLTILSAFGTPENFSAKITDTDTDCIYKGTARAVGGELLFFTSSGLKAFDGTKIRRVAHRYEGRLTSPVSSAEFAGEYFLACAEGVLCYNPADGESYVIGLAANCLCAADCVYAFNGSGVFRLAESGEFTFVSETDFGAVKRKTLTEIFVGGVADIEVSCGGKTRSFSGAGGKIRPRLRGENFTVTVRGRTPIASLTARAEVCGGI